MKMKKIPRQSQWLWNLAQSVKRDRIRMSKEKVIIRKNMAKGALFVLAFFILSVGLFYYQQPSEKITGLAGSTEQKTPDQYYYSTMAPATGVWDANKQQYDWYDKDNGYIYKRTQRGVFLGLLDRYEYYGTQTDFQNKIVKDQNPPKGYSFEFYVYKSQSPETASSVNFVQKTTDATAARSVNVPQQKVSDSDAAKQEIAALGLKLSEDGKSYTRPGSGYNGNYYVYPDGIVYYYDPQQPGMIQYLPKGKDGKDPNNWVVYLENEPTPSAEPAASANPDTIYEVVDGEVKMYDRTKREFVSTGLTEQQLKQLPGVVMVPDGYGGVSYFVPQAASQRQPQTGQPGTAASQPTNLQPIGTLGDAQIFRNVDDSKAYLLNPYTKQYLEYRSDEASGKSYVKINGQEYEVEKLGSDVMIVLPDKGDMSLRYINIKPDGTYENTYPTPAPVTVAATPPSAGTSAANTQAGTLEVAGVQYTWNQKTETWEGSDGSKYTDEGLAYLMAQTASSPQTAAESPNPTPPQATQLSPGATGLNQWVVYYGKDDTWVEGEKGDTFVKINGKYYQWTGSKYPGDPVWVTIDGQRFQRTTENGNIYLTSAATGNKFEQKDFFTWRNVGQMLNDAYNSAKAGRTLSILLGLTDNSWRRTMDAFFVHTVLGSVISGNWEESMCHHYIERPPEGTIYVIVPDSINMVGIGAHVEAERAESQFANQSGQQTEYFYKISIYVKNPEKPTKRGQSIVQDMNFNVFLHGQKTVQLFKNSILVTPGKSFIKVGSSVIVQYSKTKYTSICIEFKDAVFTADGKEATEVCNSITSYKGEPTEYIQQAQAATATGTAAKGTEVNQI